jgi:ribosome-binding factor A
MGLMNMGASLRTRKLGSLLQAELADLLRRRVKDPRLHPITLTGVDVSPDLSMARVYFSVLDENKLPDAQNGFAAAAPFLRSQLASNLRLKTVPRLVAVFDRALRDGAHMESLIRQVIARDQMGKTEKSEDEV